jgi:hypothetical protein
MMCFVDNEKIGAVETVEPSHESCDTRDLYRQQRRFRMSGCDNSVRHAKRVESSRNLIYYLLPVAENYDTIAALDGTGNDMRKEHGLSAAGGRLIKYPTCATEIFGANFRNIGLLICPENWRRDAGDFGLRRIGAGCYGGDCHRGRPFRLWLIEPGPSPVVHSPPPPPTSK